MVVEAYRLDRYDNMKYSCDIYLYTPDNKTIISTTEPGQQSQAFDKTHKDKEELEHTQK